MHLSFSRCSVIDIKSQINRFKMSKISTAKTEDISTAPQKECPCICVGFAEGAVGVKSLTVKSKSSAEIIDFGEVLPGSETIRCVDLKNFLDQPVSYYIHRMSYVNGIYQSFHFNKYNMTINPRATLQLKITYCPLLENEKSSDLFWLSTRDSTEVEKLRLVGKCLGTKIKCSTKTLQFIWTPSVKKRVNTFELRNVSRVPATFQFDVNENEEFFEVDIVNGQIQPKKSIYITVTFNGKVEGVHYKRLVVLIYKHVSFWYHNASIIDSKYRKYSIASHPIKCVKIQNLYAEDDIKIFQIF